jgi:hypothetical protein
MHLLLLTVVVRQRVWKSVAVAHPRIEEVECVPAGVVVVWRGGGAGALVVVGEGCGGPAAVVADAVHVGDGAVVAAPLVVQPIHGS